VSADLTTAARGEPEQLFGIRRTWFDPAPGIELVQVHYTWTPPGADPDWEAADTRVLTPSGATPRLRTAVIEVPRRVGGSTDYLLHHFFFVVRGAESLTSPVFTEEIVAREIVHEDPTGDWTHVGIAWGVSPGSADLAAPNYTAAAMDGLPFEDAGAGAPAEPAPIHEFVRAQPLPHVFRGLVWGPRGFDLRYVLHLVRAGSPRPEEDTEVWADDGGRPWTMTL
jgi:hypothetical protein